MSTSYVFRSVFLSFFLASIISLVSLVPSFVIVVSFFRSVPESALEARERGHRGADVGKLCEARWGSRCLKESVANLPGDT